MSRPLWQLLLLTRDSKKSIHLTCEECFGLLEFDADLLTAGVSLDEIIPSVSHHLALCPECQTKFDAWLANPEGDAESSAGS